jgi:hypothetical protein
MKNFYEIYAGLMHRFLGRSLRREDGLNEEEIQKAERLLGLRLPLSMREYYRVVGAVDQLNRLQNVIFSPKELYVEDEFLMFMDENQSVVSWGLKISELSSPDPTAWQRNNTPPEQWLSEEKTFSELLESMFEWYEEAGIWEMSQEK